MPVLDWMRVTAGIFHHFHAQWIAAISNALNTGRLPSGYYALAEHVAGDTTPDVLALQVSPFEEQESQNFPGASADSTSRTALAVAEPNVRDTAGTEMDAYALKQNALVIRHSSGALVEIVSPGNKGSRHALRGFVYKAASALYSGYQMLILDLQPPGPLDPNRIHGAIWGEIADDSFGLDRKTR